MAEPNETHAELARALRAAGQEKDLPDWLAAVMESLAANISLVAPPPTQKPKPTSFVYFH